VPKSTHLYLIRHAPTGVHGRYIGHTDVECVLPSGIHEHSPLPHDAPWFCSDLQRCATTATWLQAQLTLTTPLIRHKALREQSFGEWEEQSYDDIYQKHPHLDWEHPASICAPRGEGFADVMTRISAYLPVVLAHEHAVIVAHSGSILAIIAHALGLTAQQAIRLRVDTGSISCVRYYGSIGTVEYINRPWLIAS
jgi:alpha-ribazole phosphatase